MDHHLNFFSLPLLSISILFLITIISILRKQSWKVPKLPPGPWKLPVIGSLHHLVGSSLIPHRRFRELSLKHGPLMHLQLGQVSTIVVSSAEMAKEIYKTHDLVFGDCPRLPGSDIIFYGPSDIVFSPIGHHWKLLRKIISQEMLSATSVRSLQALREKEVSSLMKSLFEEAKEGSCVNLSEKVFVTIGEIISKSAFGKKKQKGKLEAILSVAKMATESSRKANLAYLFHSYKWLHVITGVTREFEDIHRRIDLVLENIIFGEESHDDEDDEGQCLLSTMLNMKDRGDLTIANVKAVMMDVIVAGIESSITVIEWVMVEMMKNPSIMKRAQAEVRQVMMMRSSSEFVLHNNIIEESTLDELQYLKAVIKETLRLHPPTPFLAPRQCSQTCKINGYTIPIGTQVLVNVWAIGRDPKYWGTSSEEFLPERFLNSSIDYKGFNFEFIPFGSGKRICPGIMLGVAIVEIILANLLCYFDWKLPFGTTEENLDMSEKLRSTMRWRSDLILVPIATSA